MQIISPLFALVNPVHDHPALTFISWSKRRSIWSRCDSSFVLSAAWARWASFCISRSSRSSCRLQVRIRRWRDYCSNTLTPLTRNRPSWSSFSKKHPGHPFHHWPPTWETSSPHPSSRRHRLSWRWSRSPPRHQLQTFWFASESYWRSSARSRRLRQVRAEIRGLGQGSKSLTTSTTDSC